MTLESGTFISDLNINYPESNVPARGGDNHLRWIKTAMKNTFPNVTGAITPTHTVINDAIAAVVAATNVNTANTLVKRDSSGNFTAGTITAALNGNVTGNTAGTHTGPVVGDVTGDTAGTHTGPVVGNASTATALATSRTIALSGDVTGSAAFNGTANATITATIADDSHNHTIANVDGLQTALNGKLGSSANAVSASKWATARTLSLGGDASGSVSIDGTANQTLTVTVNDDSHNHTIANVDGLQASLNAKLGSNSNAVSASKWATARTLSLSGDASGSVSIDGSANRTLSVTVNDDSHDHVISNVDGLQTALNGKLGSGSNAVSASKWVTPRTLSLGGDASGSVSIDGSANATLSVTVNDDSHDHVISNVDGLQSALDGKLGTGSNAVSASKWQTARTLSLSGDASGSVSIDGSANSTLSVTVNDDSHNHTIANVDGLQSALNGKLGSTATATNSDKVDGYHISTSATGTDSNTIYFRT